MFKLVLRLFGLFSTHLLLNHCVGVFRAVSLLGFLGLFRRSGVIVALSSRRGPLALGVRLLEALDD